MKELVRGTDLVGLPVVTLAGDDIAEVRDVVYDGDAGQVIGFTLNKRGRRLGGRLKEVLRSDQIRAVGPAAVIVAAGTDLGRELDEEATPTGAGGKVLASVVMTDAGVNVGTVTDVVVDTGTGKVVGYEVQPADEPPGRKGRRSYVPLPETGAVSGEALIVPATAVDYIRDDLAGFGEAVDRYRNQLGGRA
jgi:sporulation protein YlmC with PRC-barrel domain